MKTTLSDQIEKRIRDIPASNPGYISLYPETLGSILSPELIREIAKAAAEVALSKKQI
jgi:hypothetical protein